MCAHYSLDAQGQLVHRLETCVATGEGLTVYCKAQPDGHQAATRLYEVVVAAHRKAAFPGLEEGQGWLIYVLAGTLAMRLGDQTFTANAGNVVEAARQGDCAIWNPTSTPARFLALATQGR